jgi:hypothetical protein
MHSPFFGAEIQPKHLVFCYLGFLPSFFVGFLLSPPTLCKENQAPSHLVLADFFPLFFKSQQLLGFLGVVTG